MRQPGCVKRPHGWSSRWTRFPRSTICFAVESQSRAAPDESEKIVTRWSCRFFPATAVAASAQQSVIAPRSARERPTSWTLSREPAVRKRGLRPQDDFERGAEPGRAADAEAAVDRRRPVAHVA